MPFIEGQVIVHPFHGPVRVVRIADRTVKNTTQRYLELEALGHPLAISVPESRSDAIGLRPVASVDRIVELMAILSGPVDEQAVGWSRRLKDYHERANTGDVEQLCWVVREITRRKPKSPATAESQLLRAVRSTLVTEFSIALGLSELEAEAIIDEAADGSSSTQMYDLQEVSAA